MSNLPLDYHQDTEHKNNSAKWTTWIGLAILWLGLFYSLYKHSFLGFDLNFFIAFICLSVSSILHAKKYVFGIYATTFTFFLGFTSLVRFFPNQYSISIGIKDGLYIELEILTLFIFPYLACHE